MMLRRGALCPPSVIQLLGGTFVSDSSRDNESLEEPKRTQGHASMPSNERLEPDAEGWSEQNMSSDRSKPVLPVPFPPAAEDGEQSIDQEDPSPTEGLGLTAGTSRRSSSSRESSVRSSRN